MCINLVPIFKAPGTRMSPVIGRRKTSNRKHLFGKNFPVIISKVQFNHNHPRTKETRLIAMKKSGSEIKFMNPTLKALLLSLYKRSPSMLTRSMRSILEVCTPNSIIWTFHKIRNLKLKIFNTIRTMTECA